MTEVRLTLKSFMLLCRLAMDTHEEKERLRKIVVMQNTALEKLSSTAAVEKRWVREYNKMQKKKLDILSDTELDPREVRDGQWWPPLGMIP